MSNITIEIGQFEFLNEIVGNKDRVISDNIVDSCQWIAKREIIFRHNDKIYHTFYEQSHVEGSSAYHPINFVCTEVEPHEVMTVEYRPVVPRTRDGVLMSSPGETVTGDKG